MTISKNFCGFQTVGLAMVVPAHIHQLLKRLMVLFAQGFGEAFPPVNLRFQSYPV
jgi:hypothetical protein